MAWLKWADGRPWTSRPVVVPVVSLFVALLFGALLAAVAAPSGSDARLVFAAAVSVGLEGILGLGVWLGGRDVARRYATWRMFGWQRPRWIDLGYAGVGLVVVFGLRAVVLGVADAASSDRAAREASNLPDQHISAPAIVLLAVVVVGCAPVLEELMFRGLMLRTFMRRMSFWPAAVLSTLLFGLFHTYEAATLLGAVVLALSVMCLGLVNCVLVRFTDRLAPGIMVHAAMNGVAVLVLALGVTGT
jgi:membrane protease YdiL (CAAX protease family)